MGRLQSLGHRLIIHKNGYRARFEADFSSIDKIISWVESRIIVRGSISSLQNQARQTWTHEHLKINRGKILREGKDTIALVLCEYVGNIIEHSIFALSKLQLYEWNMGQCKINVKGKKKHIECVLKVRATHFILECSYPFLLKSYYKRDGLKIGKKGKKILNLMGAREHSVIKRLKIPLVCSSLLVKTS